MPEDGSGESGVGSRKGGRRGAANPHWKGGTYVNPDGYLRISAGLLRGVYVHLLVLEGKLGRPLAEDEEGPHINGDTLDCRPENLEVKKLEHHRAFLYGRPWVRRAI